MDLTRVLSELRSQRDRLNQAITALEGITYHGAGRSRTNRQSATGVPKRRGVRGGISAAGRRRLSQLMKKRWAQGKMKRKAKAA